MKTKCCTNPDCTEVNPQPVENFYKKKIAKDGLQYHCKTCTNKFTKKWKEENPEKAKESLKKASKKWKEENPEKAKESDRKSGKKWREKNPEKVIEFQKNYYKKNRDFDHFMNMLAVANAINVKLTKGVAV